MVTKDEILGWHHWLSEHMSESCSRPTLCNPTGYTVHGILQARILERVVFSFSRGSSQLRDWTQAPALRADSLPAEPPGKSKNTGVGSLSLLQRIFLIQESIWGLPHCGWILYQLSYQGTWVWAYWEIRKDREAWHAVVHDVAKRQTQLSDWTTTTI